MAFYLKKITLVLAIAFVSACGGDKKILTEQPKKKDCVEDCEIDKKIRKWSEEMKKEEEKLAALRKTLEEFATPEFSWDNVLQAAKQFLLAEPPKDADMHVLEYQYEINKQANQLTKYIFLLDYNRGKIEKACYSKDINEIQNNCISIYYIQYQ